MRLKSSHNLVLLLLLSHALVLIVVCLTALPLAIRLLLFLPIFTSLAYALARDALLLLPDSLQQISFAGDCLTVITRNGISYSAKVSRQTVVTPCFVCLSLEGSNRYSAIFSDALDKELFRELRVFLKFN